MNVKQVSFASVILMGYVALSFGILKVLWRQFGFHFDEPGIAHLPHAGTTVDSVLIIILVLSGMSLVAFRAVVPALVCLIGTFIFEFAFNHDDTHNVGQYVFAAGAIACQLATLAVYLSGYSVLDRALSSGRSRFPPQDV